MTYPDRVDCVSVYRPWCPPRGTTIMTVCARHPERILRAGAVGPAGECSHGMCAECEAAMLKENQS